jgi:hypothetical protein
MSPALRNGIIYERFTLPGGPVLTMDFFICVVCVST